MAQNVIIDIDARTNKFERALDELTAKVRSTADQIDKAFSTSGNAEKSIKSTSNAVSELHSGLKEISLIAAGNVLADGFEKALGKIKQLGSEIYATTARMQSLEMGMKSIVTSDLVKTGQVADYTEATQRAQEETQKLMDWFKELSLKSPYELVEVMESFKQNANMGQSVEIAKKTTEAILALGAGLGMGQAEMKRFSAALAQTGATGRITAMDLRQFANNGFGMDKMNEIFSILSEKYQIVIKDNNDFNKAVAEGKITTDDFFEALNTFALDNYGGAIDAMASTIEGLKSSMGDIKVSAINDLFLETSKTVSKTLAPYVEYLMQLLTGGDFKKWGESINNWAKGLLEPIQKIGETLGNGVMSRAISSLKDFFSGKSLNLGAVKTMLADIGGEEFADKWLNRIKRIKEELDKILEHKDTIISAIKGIGVALATAFAVNKISGFISMLTGLNNPITRLTLLGAAFGVAWSENLFHIQEKSAGVIAYIQSLIETFKKDGISGVIEKIKTDLVGAFDNVKNAISAKFSDIQNAFQTDGLKGVFELLVSDVQPVLQKIWDGLPEGFKAKIETIISDINTFIEPIKNAIQGAFSYVGDLKDVFNTEGISGVFDKLFTDAVSGIKETLTNILPEGVLETLETIWSWIERITQAIGGIAIGWGALNLIGGLSEVISTIELLYAGITGTVEVGGLLGTVLTSIGSMGVASFAGVAGQVALLIASLVEGFAILGQFINFGELIKNIFNVVKDSVANVIEGIITNVAPKLQGLLETLAPAGTALAAIITEVGVIILGVINGLFRAIDDVLAAVIDAADVIVSVIRLPFDILVSLGAFIVGVVTGDVEKIQWAWEHLVERLEHIWTSFKAFWEDLGNGIQDFFIGIWETIAAFINSIDISEGLRRLFGEEVAQEFEGIRDKVLGFIEEIKNAWTNAMDLISGRKVNVEIGTSGKQTISSGAYAAFENKYQNELLYMRNAKVSDSEQDYRNLFFEQYDEKSPWYYANYNKDDFLKYKGMEESDLLLQFYQDIFTDIRNQISSEKERFHGNLSDEKLRKSADEYIEKNYDWTKEDPYFQSNLDQLYEQMGLNTEAIKENTASTDENTSKTTEGKAESTVQAVNEMTDAQIQFTKEQTELLQSALDEMLDELNSSEKEYNTEAIENLRKIVEDTPDYSTVESILGNIENWLTDDVIGVGLDDNTEKLIMDALSSATDTDTLLSMLDAIVTALETGNTELISKLAETSENNDKQQSETVKTVDDILNKHVEDLRENQEKENKGLISELLSGVFGKQLGEDIFGNKKEVDEKTQQSLNEIIQELQALQQIEKLENGSMTDKEFADAKQSFLEMLKELNYSKSEVQKIEEQLNDKNTTQTDLAEMWNSLFNILRNEGVKIPGLPKQQYGETDSYYEMEKTLRKFIADEMPEILKDSIDKGELTNTKMLEYAIKEMETYTKNSSQFSDEQFQSVMISALKHSGLPDGIQNAFISAISTNGVSKDFISSYISVLVSAVQEAGLLVANTIENTNKQSSNFGLLGYEAQDAIGTLYNEFLADHANEITREITRAMHEGLSEDEARTKVLTERGYDEATWLANRKGADFIMDVMFNQVMPSMNDFIGNKLDSLRHVTVDNMPEAKDLIGDTETWNKTLEELTHGQTDYKKVLEELPKTLDGIFGPELAETITGKIERVLQNTPIELRGQKLLEIMTALNTLIPDVADIKAQVAAIEASGKTYAFQKDWDERFTAAYDAMYEDFLSGHTYEISKDTKGMDATAIEEYMREKGYDKQSYYDSQAQYHELMETLQPALASAMDAVGLNADKFQHVTVDNMAEAKDYVGSFDEFNTLFQDVMTGLTTDNETIALQLEHILEGLTDDTTAKQLSDMIRASDDPQWTKMLMMLLNMDLKSMATELADAIANIKLQVGGGSGSTTATTKGTNAETQAWMDKWDENWKIYNDTSSSALQKAEAISRNQAILDMMYFDGSYNFHKDAGHISVLDPLMNDPEYVKQLRAGMIDTLDKGMYDDKNAYNASYKANMGWQLEHNPELLQHKTEEAKHHVDEVVQAANEGLDSIEENLEEKESLFGDGILGMLFGEDFTKEDFSELFALGFEGMTEFLNEDTVKVLEDLFGIEITEEKAEAWKTMAEALDTLGEAMSGLKDALGGDTEYIETLKTSMEDLMAVSLDEAKIENWKNFAEALTTLGTSLQSIAPIFGNGTVSAAGSFSKDADYGSMIAESNSNLVDSLQKLANIKIDENAGTNWTNFANGVSAMSGALSSISNAINSDGFDIEAIKSAIEELSSLLSGDLQPASSEEISDLLSEGAKGSLIDDETFDKAIGTHRTRISKTDELVQKLQELNSSADGLEGLDGVTSALDEIAQMATSFADDSFEENVNTFMRAISALLLVNFEETDTEGLANFATNLMTMGNALTSMKDVFSVEEGETSFIESLRSLCDISIDEAKAQGWASFAEALTALAPALETIKSAFGIGLETEGEEDAENSITGLIEGLKALADLEFSGDGVAAFAEQWAAAAEPIMQVAEALNTIFGYIELINGQNQEGQTATLGVETEAEGEVMNGGIFGMLFGSMDAESIIGILNALNTDSLQALMAFVMTPIDQSVIEGWTMFGASLSQTAFALMTMMTALTGGTQGELDEEGNIISFGELGDEEMGSAFTDAFIAFAETAVTIAPQIDVLNESLTRMSNLLLDIKNHFTELEVLLRTSIPKAIESFLVAADKAIPKIDELTSMAASAEQKFLDWANAIWAVVNALRALADAQGGDGGGGGTGGGNNAKSASGSAPTAAGGTSGWRYGTAIVGEHGPELLTNNGSRAWTVFSNNTLMDEIAHTRHALNLLSNGAEYFAENRMFGGSTSSSSSADNSQNITNNFNGLMMGEDAFAEFVDEKVTETMRRELLLARY